MTVEALMRGIDYEVLQKGEDAEVTELLYDSRKEMHHGACFACESGLMFDGTDYLDVVREKGAVLAVMEKRPEKWPEGLTMLKVENVRAAMARMAFNFYAHVIDDIKLIGLTGTNGKTTTSTLIHHILMENGGACGLIGTNGNHIGHEVIPATHTTPYPFDLYKIFARMKEANMKEIVMEVSSHALDQHRVDGITYQLGLFTNLSQDHLDYHKTMEAYLEAKCKLFYQSERGLINGDDAVAGKILATKACPFTTFGMGEACDYHAENVKMDAHGLQYDWYYHDEKLGQITYSVPGKFNVYNTLAAAGSCHMLGVDAETIVKAVSVHETFVAGRFEVFHSNDNVTAIVDYAHTPDGLSNVLQTVAEFVQGKTITVFGCGGDRDPKKRPIMGEIAGKLSDYCLITSDNPRTEDPEAIIDEVEVGMRQTNCAYERITDRREAIAKAIQMAEPGDVVMVAGKGHEDYQIIGREKIHLDDREEVKKALENRGGQ